MPWALQAIAHRGTSSYAPENTYASFDLALRAWSEVRVEFRRALALRSEIGRGVAQLGRAEEGK